jgi:hypothetical protein
MKKCLFLLLVTVFLILPGQLKSGEGDKNTAPKKTMAEGLYAQLQPAALRPSLKVFKLGIKGYEDLFNGGQLKNQRFLTLIDYSLSSKEKRLWVIDKDSLKVVHHCLVSHGKNTGEEYALHFSNRPQSYMSSMGFFLTGNTYTGKNGLSLLLDGLEAGINDNARERAIVMHGAEYATRGFINQHGRLGRSFGCPAMPPEENRAVIQTIKGGTCVFIYFPAPSYLTSSRFFMPSAS